MVSYDINLPEAADGRVEDVLEHDVLAVLFAERAGLEYGEPTLHQEHKRAAVEQPEPA